MAEIIINKEKHECAPAVAAYIKELKKENARLEELYQKSVGVIAATDCEECQAWIDASIRLPDDNGDVLVWYQCKCCGKTSQSWGITFCSRGDWYKKHLDGECINVLFWRKLPKPPTRECDPKMDGGAEDECKKCDRCGKLYEENEINELKTENEALKLLIEWAEECDFGYDNFPEEYERYKDEIEGMGYIEGMIHIAKRVYQQKIRDNARSNARRCERSVNE